ncbi:MAG: proton-conducting transporter membrane subunit [Candidatus Methanofastidiosia archaeon]|jgi:multicomponent Na+:H+ antiporter subunit D
MVILIYVFLVVPVIGAGLVFLRKSRSIAIACTVTTVVGLLFSSVSGIAGEYTIKIWMNPVPIIVYMDNVSTLIGVLTSFLFFMAVIYSSYIKDKKYYALLLLDLSFLLCVVFSSQLLIFYVFLEMSTIVTYFLIIYKRTSESIDAGFKFVIMNIGGAVFILMGILLYIFANPVWPFLFITGCLIKCGSFPVHIWLADAHPAAPSPVSALLSGVMVKIGVYGIFRFAPLFQGDISWVIVPAVASMVIGAFLALVQTDIKRILAYSTVSQIGFILLGIVLYTEQSIAGSILHVVNHGLFKGLLFLSMGCVIYATGERNLHKLGGLKSMRVTAVACLVGSLSISGIPPFNGFISKNILFHGLPSGILKILFIIACGGTIASFIKLFRHTFLGEKSGITIKEVPFSMKVPLVILSSLCVILGIFPGIILSPLQYTYMWDITALPECVLTISLGGLLYIGVLKTGLVFNPPHVKMSVDRLFCDTGRFVQKVSHALNSWVTQDINYYVACMVVVLLLFWFWFTTII